ncbi:MAG TPA: DUF4097 family beta strand repeat-containing protein, partial [Pyrinomonadaceae bacterium]|nr:DUF4097 family beta strand repeat-containing protein [Pyrinomonadaceae bacterium]
RITAWDRAEVRVDAVKRATTRERLDEAKIVVEASSDSVNIESRYPEKAFNYDGGDRRGRNNYASVDYVVSVPRNARLESIEVISGKLDIENVSGGVKASCISGSFTARNLSGDARLSNVSGMLEATFERLDDSSDVTLSNVSGQLVVVIPSDTNGTIKANTLSGQISNNMGLPVRRGEYVGNDLAGQLGRGGARIKLNNVSGQIKIQRADGGNNTNVKSLISESRRTVVGEDVSQEEVQRRVEREIERAMQDAERNVERAGREVERVNRTVERTATGRERATRDAAQRNERAQRDAERATRALERDQARIERDVERAAREIESAMDDHERSVAENSESSYRLVERDGKSFNVSGVPRVVLKTFDGSINIQPSNELTVRFSAVKRARDEQAMRGIRLRAEQTGDTINIIAEFDKTLARKGGEYDTGAAVALEVWVPRRANVQVQSGDGRLRLSGIEGEIDLNTGDGSVDVTESKGRLKVETGDGRVRVAGFDGDASVQTGDGRISLDGRFTKLSARTGDGAITLALPADINARIETDSERVFNDLSAVAEEAETAEGERRVRHWRVGSGAGSQITLRTGDGQIFLRRTGEERE